MCYDVIIIGLGAAGLSAALYGGRYNLKILIFGQKFGGQTRNAGIIENYPGIKSIDGFDLMINLKEQVVSLGGTIKDEAVSQINKKNNLFHVQTSKSEYISKTLIVASGAERKKINLPNEERLAGKGIHYCPTCDGPLYQDKVVAMIGGSDAAIKGVNLLANYARKIYVINLEDQITAEPINYQQTQKLADQVEIILSNTVTQIIGTNKLENIILKKPYQGKKEIKVDGMFIEIGAVPNISLLNKIDVVLDKTGYIQVNNLMQTNIAGLYAAGDITNHFGTFKQIITAAAQGSVAVTSAYQYLKSQ